MADPRKLKDKAADLAAKGKLEKAAALYREAMEADPRDVATRQKLADVLRRTGEMAEAIDVYRGVAERYANDGLLIKAIAICKTILELDPSHGETQQTLADLYARRSAVEGRPQPAAGIRGGIPRPSPEMEPEPVVAIPLDPAPEEPFAPAGPSDAETPFAQIVNAAGEAVGAGIEADVVLDLEPEPLDDLEIVTEPVEAAPQAPSATPPAPEPVAEGEPAELVLPAVPIFSDLSRDAFIALTTDMVLHRVGKGEKVISEGETGASFYVVAGGRFAVSKRDERGEDVALAYLGEGDFFGEMALISGAPRAATVTADEPGEVLEFRADVLLALASRYPHLAKSLRRFYRQRLLANAMAMSPIFRPFSKDVRKLVMERFRSREVAPGDVVVREGTRSDGLYVILDGAVDVVKRKIGTEVTVAQLREGDLFGEMSCLLKTPASATILVSRGGTLLRLPRAAFDEVVASYPQILELVAELSEERAENLDAILSGHAQWTEEGLVLI